MSRRGRGPARRAGPSDDPLHKATLLLRQHGVGVELEVLEGTFAAAGVDAGTRHLLRWLAGERFAAVTSVLDVGCGYGPLGLWLAAAAPARRVTAVDRDARAVEATSVGAARNGLADRVQVLGSLGYDAVADGRFDLIVSNLPAKAGPAARAHLLLDAYHRSAPGGLVAVVAVARLAAEVAGTLEDDAVEVLEHHPSRAYTAFVYRFAGAPVAADPARSFERGAYRRGEGSFHAGPRSWTATVAHDLAEFDTLSHGTLAAVEVLATDADRHGLAVVAGTGQGHLPLALHAGGHEGRVRLVDRDLLALRTSEANVLAHAGDRPEVAHDSRLRAAHLDGAACALVGLPEREPVSVTAALLGRALPGLPARAELVLHGRTSDVQRVAELLPRHGARLEVRDRRRHAGHAAVRARVLS